MANEIDLWKDLEEAVRRKDRKEFKKIKKELLEKYPDLKLGK